MRGPTRGGSLPSVAVCPYTSTVQPASCPVSARFGAPASCGGRAEPGAEEGEATSAGTVAEEQPLMPQLTARNALLHELCAPAAQEVPTALIGAASALACRSESTPTRRSSRPTPPPMCRPT